MIEFKELITIGTAIIIAFCGWLWSLIHSNTKATSDNNREIALLDQSLKSHVGKVNGMEEKVTKLSEELTQVKFSLQSLEFKQDKHHTELMNELRSWNKSDV